MAKLLIFLLCMFLFVSCNQSDCANQGKQSEGNQINSSCPIETNPQPIPGPIDDGSEIPPEASIFNINAKLFGFDTQDEEKVHRAIEIIKQVVGSSEFKARVLNFTYQNKQRFFEDNGLTNEQIYQKILEGSEELSPEIDYEMDLELELYYSWKSTVGYTYANKPRIYINTRYFDSYTPAEVAGNLFHEWTHKLGFKHASSNTAGRSSTVPYVLGYLVEELGKQYEYIPPEMR